MPSSSWCCFYGTTLFWVSYFPERPATSGQERCLGLLSSALPPYHPQNLSREGGNPSPSLQERLELRGQACGKNISPPPPLVCIFHKRVVVIRAIIKISLQDYIYNRDKSPTSGQEQGLSP